MKSGEVLTPSGLKQLEQLRARVAELEAIRDALPDRYLLLDYAGVPIGSASGSSLDSLLGQEVAGKVCAALDEVRLSKVPASVDTSSAPGPEQRFFENRILPVAGDKFVVIVTDVTEQRDSERALRASQVRYTELLENANDIIYTHDLSGKMISLNRAGKHIAGYADDDPLDLGIWDFIAPEYVSRAQNMIQRKLGGGGPTTYELEIISKNGQRTLLEVSSRLLFHNGAPAGVQGIARDITERRRMEEQLRQSQKLEAIGVLAGGVAHDFNNLLTGILGYTSLLSSETLAPERVREAVDVIQKAAERAAELTSQLLGFARRGKHQNVPVDVHEALTDAVELLERTIDKRIEVVCDFQAERHHILGDPGQMQQVFLNLALNARDAMPLGGKLTFRTEIAEARQTALSVDPALPPGLYLLVSVLDTGHGIRRDIKDRIFEPFFTTKEPAKGTGMGLAMVYGIVKNHGGVIHVESEVGRGTTFRLHLPLHDRVTKQPVIVASEAPAAGKGRILVVDDEEVVRQVASSMLRKLGYDVVAANGPQEAINYYRDHWKQVDLVLMDMVMPHINGKECFAALRTYNPEIRALLTSGYGRDGAIQDTLNSGLLGFLEKPYKLGSLAQTIAAAMNSPAAE